MSVSECTGTLTPGDFHLPGGAVVTTWRREARLRVPDRLARVRQAAALADAGRLCVRTCRHRLAAVPRWSGRLVGSSRMGGRFRAGRRLEL